MSLIVLGLFFLLMERERNGRLHPFNILDQLDHCVLIESSRMLIRTTTDVSSMFVSSMFYSSIVASSNFRSRIRSRNWVTPLRRYAYYVWRVLGCVAVLRARNHQESSRNALVVLVA
jgi:hypothetical protein